MYSKSIFFSLFLIIGTCSCASIVRTNEEVESFRKFLANSVDGKPQEPLNEELRELQNEWERSGKFEGDIILTQEQQKALVENYKNVDSRNALLNSSKLWPGKVLYYNITTSYFTPEQIAAIEDGLENMANISCVQFKKANSSSIAFVNVTGQTSGCFSSVGFVGSVQVLNLAPYSPGSGCFRHATIMHEFLHALGFYHMQSTYNRDDYVRIVWDKIQPGTENNFNKYSNLTVSNLGTEYDYGSAMHYSEYGFSIDGNKTMEPLKETDKVIGQRIQLSEEDIIKLNRLYSCPGF